MLNCLDPDQDQCSVSPDLVPNCLQRLPADDKKLPLERKELNVCKKNVDFNFRSKKLKLLIIVSRGIHLFF